MITISIPAQPRPLKRSWSMGANTCHAPIVMRSDLQKQMCRVHQELGFRYWRAHGTLSDDVGIYTEYPDGKCHYTFSGLKRIIDAVLETGLKPFLELSFMPSALARDSEKTITHYHGITEPPVDFKTWEELIHQTAAFLHTTYGVEELRTWYFEVWNEPNIPFWTGTQNEYFKLYRHAAKALKAVHPELRVGGPATARGEWIADFLDDCLAHNTPVDFISTHIYPSDVAFVDSDRGEVELLGMDFLRQHFARVHDEVHTRMPGLPIFWGEWNSSAGPLAENHDTCNNAAVIASALAGIEQWADGSLFWNLSDIYEECAYHFAPFHGGYGLLTVDDIPKAAFRAFELFQQLAHWAITVETPDMTAERGAIGSISDNLTEIQLILWNHESQTHWQEAITLPEGFVATSVHRILPTQGSAYESWCEMGKPMNLNPEQLESLYQASRPATSNTPENNMVSIPSGTVAAYTFQKTQ